MDHVRRIGNGIGLVSKLSARKWSPEKGWEDLGVLGRRCVTDVFCNLLADCLQGGASGLVDLATFKYHDCGTGTNAEDQTDTALQTPSGMARVVGTQVEGSSAYIYKSVATVTSTISGTTAITEHGLFHESSGGILMDRTVFGAINVDLGNKIEFTYELNIIAGG
ncbi:MAG: hypothetical protein WC551_09035 [Patescibacteria group bacterium]